MRKMILVDYDYCTGCHTCEVACQQEHGLEAEQFGIKLTQIGPDQITDREWQYEFVPVPTERCDKCASRLAVGKEPSCVKHCQAGCLKFGTLEELSEFTNKKKVALFT
ncbi:MAG: oxidoreductase [Gordonibacter sp.]|nr:oxidoreductase [Gordonibacter sp.]